jgi:hypothetical protein
VRRYPRTNSDITAEPERAAFSSHLSLPFSLRFAVVKRPALLKRLERRLVWAAWCWQRRVARRLGVSGSLRGGAVVFTQWFGSTLQLIDQSRYPT